MLIRVRQSQETCQTDVSSSPCVCVKSVAALLRVFVWLVRGAIVLPALRWRSALRSGVENGVLHALHALQITAFVRLIRSLRAQPFGKKQEGRCAFAELLLGCKPFQCLELRVWLARIAASILPLFVLFVALAHSWARKRSSLANASRVVAVLQMRSAPLSSRTCCVR